MTRRTAARILPVLGAGLVLAACAGSPPPDPRIADLGARIDRAQADPDIGRYSQAQLQQASRYLAQARKDDAAGNSTATGHDLYMGQRELDVARTRAEAQALQAQRQAIAARIQAAPSHPEAAGSLTLTNVLFSPGKAQLLPGATAELQQLAQYLQANPGMTATVEGFTDSSGNAQYNRQLSQARAEAVKQFLVNAGVPASRVVARGMGESYPVASNATAAGRQENRRVEVVLKQA